MVERWKGGMSSGDTSFVARMRPNAWVIGITSSPRGFVSQALISVAFASAVVLTWKKFFTLAASLLAMRTFVLPDASVCGSANLSACAAVPRLLCPAPAGASISQCGVWKACYYVTFRRTHTYLIVCTEFATK